MTTTTIDVNQAFLAERQGQIASAFAARDHAIASAAKKAADFDARVASGELRALGNGRFEVATGFDAGEIWTLRQTELGPLVLPEHGLDESKGTVALYSAVPTWHGAGTVIPGGITDIQEVLRLGGIDFTVGIKPSEFQPRPGVYKTVKDSFTTFREDTEEALGSVGKIYTPFQNLAAFQFLQDLVLKHDVVWESAGALHGGTRVFISMRLPRELHIDPEGINDEIIPFVVFLNSHDGSTKVRVCISPWRPVCDNTERFTLRDASARWGHSHTKRVHEKVYEARKELELSMAYFDSFIVEETALLQTPMRIDEFIKTIKDVFEPPKDDASPADRQLYSRRAADMIMRWEDNSDRLGGNAYSAERAFTEHLDRRELRPRGELRGQFAAARATRILEGDHDQLKTKVHKRLMTLVRR